MCEPQSPSAATVVVREEKTMSTFLTRAELRELTGRARKLSQIEVLRANGIAHFVNAAGWPVVPRAAIEGRTMSVPRQRWSPTHGTPKHTA